MREGERKKERERERVDVTHLAKNFFIHSEKEVEILHVSFIRFHKLKILADLWIELRELVESVRSTDNEIDEERGEREVHEVTLVHGLANLRRSVHMYVNVGAVEMIVGSESESESEREREKDGERERERRERE